TASSSARMLMHTGRRGRSRRSPSSTGWVGWLFVLPGFAGLVVFVIAPMVASLGLGFFDSTLLGGTTFAGPDHFLRLVRDQQFLTSLRVTTVFVLVYTPLH